MDEVIMPSRGTEQTLFEQVLAHYDAPAYIRRARRVEEALEQLLARCRTQREEWLEMVRLRLGRLRGLADTWSALAPLLADAEQSFILEALHDELRPALRVPVQATADLDRLRHALDEWNVSCERFNRRWLKFLHELDLQPLNELREGYNRYYILEKECAVRSGLVATQGFRPLEPMTVERLLTYFPLMPVVGLRDVRKR